MGTFHDLTKPQPKDLLRIINSEHCQKRVIYGNNLPVLIKDNQQPIHRSEQAGYHSTVSCKLYGQV